MTADTTPAISAALCGQLVASEFLIVENPLSDIITVHSHGTDHPAVHLVDLDAVLTVESVLSS